MIKQLILVLVVFVALAIAQDQCSGADVSGPNVASPAKRQSQPSASCQANVSGPNVASPGRFVRQSQVCSGNGYCSGENCVCLSGFTGADCETAVPSTSCQADVSGPNVASPGKRQSQQCSGNGSCQNGQCVCNSGFFGADCEVPVSSSCSQADVSGPNVASPGRFLRQAQVCSGNGYCVGNKLCVCNAGFSGANCENQATTCPPTAAPTTAAPTTAAPTEAPTTAAPTTAAPTKTPSQTCQQADVSGPNVASPGRSLRQTQACNGNGVCDGDQVCVCNAGYSGVDCEVAPSTAAPTEASTTAAPTTAAPTVRTPAPSCQQADVSGPNVASPGRFLRQTQVCSGNGVCDGDQVCVCNAGFSGVECENAASTTAPTDQISGDNNARSENGAEKIISIGGILVAVVAVALL